MRKKPGGMTRDMRWLKKGQVHFNTCEQNTARRWAITCLSPVAAPRILHQPVRGGVQLTPTDHLHAVKTLPPACLLLVDGTRVLALAAVGLKIRVYIERDVDGAAGQDLLHDRGFALHVPRVLRLIARESLARFTGLGAGRDVAVA